MIARQRLIARLNTFRWQTDGNPPGGIHSDYQEERPGDLEKLQREVRHHLRTGFYHELSEDKKSHVIGFYKPDLPAIANAGLAFPGSEALKSKAYENTL